jgi:hypothetical protein
MTLDDPQNGATRVTFIAADTDDFVPRIYWYTVSRIDVPHNQVLAYGEAHLQGRVL